MFNDRELDEILKMKFDEVKDGKILQKLITISDGLIYSLYYDIFISAGLERNGPYDVSKRFGHGAKMVIFDYYNLNPQTIWKHLKNFKHRKLKVYLVYKDCNVKIDFLNRFIAPQDFIHKIIYFRIESSPKSTVRQIVKDFSDHVMKQTKYVESLKDIDKVRYGALIYHYQFKNFREKMLGFWKPKYVDVVIQKFGEEFIEKFKNPNILEPKEYVEFYDPRSNKSF